jgi:hypothetical protein
VATHVPLQVSADSRLGGVVTQSDEMTFVCRVLPGRSIAAGALACYDRSGNVIKTSRVDSPNGLANGAADDDVLYMDSDSAHLVRARDLSETKKSPRLGLDAWFGKRMGVVAIEHGGGHEWVSYGESIVWIRATPTWATTTYASPVGRVHDACGRPGTSQLIVAGSPNRFAVLDVDTGATLRTETLACRDVAYDVAANGRRAWVSTKDGDGSFVELALDGAGGGVVRSTGATGRTQLDLSRDGRMLAVAANTDGSVGGTVCVALYDVSGELREVGRTSFERDDAVNDIAVFNDGTVVVSGDAATARIVRFAPAAK